MKKVYLKSFLVLLVITLVISCTKELMNIPKDALTIEKAKAWYELQKTIPVMMLKSAKADKKADCTPDWEKAFASINDELEVVEAPLISQTHFNFYTKESMDLRNNNKESDYLNSNSRIVIQKNKKTGFRECYIMTIIGDADYLNTKRLQLKNNSYLKKEKDFSGFVLYHDTDGLFVNGWRYNNGKISGVITSSSQDQTIFRLKLTQPLTSQDCTKYTFWITYDNWDYVKGLYWQDTVSNSWIVCETLVGNGLATPTPAIGGGTPGNPNPSDPAPDAIVTHFEKNPCVGDIYNALMSRNTLSNMTYYFMGVNSTDLTWNIGVLPTTEDGITESDINKPGIINITLSSTMTNKASGVYIATVMFHEALHAEMLRVIRAHGGIIRDDDPFLYDRYKIYANDKTYDTPDHNDIAYNYRQQIIKAVNDYDAACNKPPRDCDELDALSWAGLMDTQAYSDFLNITKNPISGIKDSAYRLILSRLSNTKETNDKNKCDGKTNNTYLE